MILSRFKAHCMAVGLALGFVAGTPMPASAQSGAPDLRVQKSCTDAPNLGTNAVSCRVDVDNMLGTAASTGPTLVVDRPVSVPPGATYVGVGQGSTFQCSTPPGGLPAAINCSFHDGLTAGNSSGNGGPVFLTFIVPPGTTLRNCADASQTVTPGTHPDSNTANNTNICTSYTRAGAVTVTKVCTVNSQGIFDCAITITNNTGHVLPAGVQVQDTLTGNTTGIDVMGWSNLGGCGAVGHYNGPLNCHTAVPVPTGNPHVLVTHIAFRLPPHRSVQNCVRVQNPTFPVVQACTTMTRP